jgi:dTDP-glucose pyrophosphorylase
LLEYACYDAYRAGFQKVFVVVRPGMEEVVFEQLKRWISPAKFQILTQTQTRKKPWGTAHALSMLYGQWTGSFLVLNADDYYGQALIKKAYDLKESGVLAASLAFRLSSTLSAHGPVSRGICLEEAGHLMQIEEVKQLACHNGEIRDASNKVYQASALVSMNAWLLPASFLTFLDTEVNDFIANHSAAAQLEIFLPDCIQKAIVAQLFEVRLEEAQSTWFGLTYKADLEQAVQELQLLEQKGVYPQIFERWT